MEMTDMNKVSRRRRRNKEV